MPQGLARAGRRARAVEGWTRTVRPGWWYGAIAVFGALVGWWATRDGLFAGNDSSTYVAVAENIRAGKGATSPFFTSIDGVSFDDAVRLLGQSPLLLWPPFYSWLLAAVADLTDATVEEAARMVAIASFAGIAVTTGALTRRLAFGSWGAAIAAAALATTYPWLIWIGSAVASDAPFLAISGGAALLLLAFASRRDPLTLTGFAAIASIACLTRFVGVGLPMAAVLVVLTTRDVGPRWRRWSLAGACAPLVPVLVWTATRSRGVEYHAHDVNLQLPADDIGEIATATWSWFRPENLASPWLWLWGLAMGGLLVLLGVRVALGLTDGLRREPARAGEPAPRIELLRCRPRARARSVALCLVTGYFVTLLLAAGMVGKYGTLDLRITLPLMPPVVAVIVAACWRLLRRPRRDQRVRPEEVDVRWAGVVPAALVVVFLLVTVSARLLGIPPRPPPIEGDAFGRAPSDLLAATEPYPLVVSSSPSAFYALTGRASVPLPLPVRPSTGAENPDFDEEMAEVRTLVHDREAIVVYVLLDAIVNNATVPLPNEVAEDLDAETLVALDSVALIGVPPE